MPNPLAPGLTELTEFTDLSPDELHLVKRGANGFPPLLAKAVAEEAVAEEIEAAKSDSPEADAQEELMTTEKSSSDEADDQQEVMTDEAAKSLCSVPDCEVCAPLLAKAKLKASQRRALPKSDFAVPGKAPKSGSYPVNDENHARNALARSSGKPEEAQVRAKVKRKFPNISAKKSPGVPDYSVDTPREAGHTRETGQSGQRIAPMTDGPFHPYEDPSYSGAGQSTYKIPNEGKIDPRNEMSDAAHGGRPQPPHRIGRLHQGSELTKAEEYGFTRLIAALQLEQLSKDAGGFMVFENSAVNVGTPEWDDLDGDTQLETALGLVARFVLARDALKADEEIAAKEGLRSARQRLTDVFGEPDHSITGDTGSAQKETITVELTPDQFAAQVTSAVEKTIDDRAKEAKKAAKAEKKTAKKAAKAEAKKNSPGNTGDITLGDMQGKVTGRSDADDVGVVKDTPEAKAAKKAGLRKELKTLTERFEKQMARPRVGGPILDGQPRGASASADGQSGTVVKSVDGHDYAISTDADIDRLEKALAEELVKKGPEAAQRASQLGYELTRKKLLQGHVTGQI
jgi:hypothetical protein